MIGYLLIGLLALAFGFTVTVIVWPDAAAVMWMAIGWLMVNPLLLFLIAILLAMLFLAAMIKDIFGLLIPDSSSVGLKRKSTPNLLEA